MMIHGSISVRRLTVFLAIGLANSAYGIALIAGLHLGLKIDLYLSNVIAYCFGGVVSYLLNRRLNFRTSATVHREAWRFAICMAIALAVSVGALRLLMWLTVPFVAAQLASIAVHAITAYLLSEFGVFTSGRHASPLTATSNSSASTHP